MTIETIADTVKQLQNKYDETDPFRLAKAMKITVADSHLWRPSGPYYPARPGHLRPLTVMPRKALYMSST